MYKTSVLAVAASVLLMASSIACYAEPMKELAVYKGNLGKWDCDAKDLGSGKSFKAVAEYTSEFDGNTYIEKSCTDWDSTSFPRALHINI